MALRISDYLDYDRDHADLLHKLNYEFQQKTPISGISDSDYPDLSALGVQETSILRHHPIPDELKDQLNQMQSNVTLGLFPEISRIWMTIDSDLFLWNSETGSDLAYFDGITSTILKVSLATPKLGFFPQNIHKLLVVATTTDILLLAIGFLDTATRHPIFSTILAYNDVDIFIVPQPAFKLSLDGLIVNDLCCTAIGRIFFCADDCLYEMNYHETLFYGRQCKKINQSKGLLHSLVPSISIFSTRDTMQQIAIDNSRNILYILTHKGHIQVFDLGVDGSSLTKFSTFSFDKIHHDCLNSFKVDASFFAKIVYLSPILCTESRFVYFEAFTSKGVRIYFTCLEDQDIQRIINTNTFQNEIRLKTIKILHIRFPPETQPFTLLRQFSVYSVLRSSENTIMALGPCETETVLWTLSPTNFISNREMQENLTPLNIRGVIWDMANISYDHRTLHGSSTPSIIARQYINSILKYNILTSEGIFTLVQNTPLEIMRQILSQFGSESKPLQLFCRLHGSLEICVMALIIICSESKADILIRNNAIRIFFSYGGEPQSQQYRTPNEDPRNLRGNILDYSPRNSSISDITSFRSPLRASTPIGLANRSQNVTLASPIFDDNTVIGNLQVRPSQRHDALYLHYSRIVSDIWQKKMCFRKSVNGQLCSSISIDVLDFVNTQIGALLKAINENALISVSSSHYFMNGNIARNNFVRDTEPIHAKDTAAIEHEKQSLIELYETINISHEILSLWQILIEHQFHVILALLPPQIIEQLTNLTLVELVHKRDTVCVDLITCLVKHYMGDDATTAAIADRLRTFCPTLFSNDDAMILKATEYLNRGRIMAASKEKDQLLSDALSILRKSIQKINLQSICDLLQKAKFFDGIVELALFRADKDDAKKIALTAYKKNAENANQFVREAVIKRENAYRCITDLLDWLYDSSTSMGSDGRMNPAFAKAECQRIIKLVLASDDELANVIVFRWILDHHMEDLLLNERHRFFESFLHHEIECLNSDRYLELLWKYYEKNENYILAAKLLLQLSDRPSAQTLHQRISYLSHSLMCVQSAPETKANLELKQEIQDKLDVAQIQAQTKEALEFELCQRHTGSNILVEELNKRLFTVSELYDRFASPYNLSIIKLAILACAGHYDKEIIENIWKDILKKELKPFERNEESAEQAKRRLASLLKKLSTQYNSIPKYCPIEMILCDLLTFSFRFTQPEWLPSLCALARISHATLLNVINNQYRVVDPFWKQNKRAYQFIVNLVINVLEDFVTDSRKLPPNERKALKGTSLDFLSFLSTDIYTDGFNNGTTAQKLMLLEDQIQRNIN